MHRQKSVIGFLVPVYVLLLTMLTGCVEYDIGVEMKSQTYGEIVQQIQLTDQLTSLTRVTLETWLDSISERARKLQGRTEMLSDGGLNVIIPFNNGADLAVKFNKFFNPAGEQYNSETADDENPTFSSSLDITQNNWLLAIRNRLQLDLDLRSLGVVSANGKVLLSPESILDLKFGLTTPWGAKIITDDANAITPVGEGSQLLWTLQPGQLNHIEAVFWVPSPIGIGTLIIILLGVGGTYLKEGKVKD